MIQHGCHVTRKNAINKFCNINLCTKIIRSIIGIAASHVRPFHAGDLQQFQVNVCPWFVGQNVGHGACADRHIEYELTEKATKRKRADERQAADDDVGCQWIPTNLLSSDEWLERGRKLRAHDRHNGRSSSSDERRVNCRISANFTIRTRCHCSLQEL